MQSTKLYHNYQSHPCCNHRYLKRQGKRTNLPKRGWGVGGKTFLAWGGIP